MGARVRVPRGPALRCRPAGVWGLAEPSRDVSAQSTEQHVAGVPFERPDVRGTDCGRFNLLSAFRAHHRAPTDTGHRAVRRVALVSLVAPSRTLNDAGSNSRMSYCADDAGARATMSTTFTFS